MYNKQIISEALKLRKTYDNNIYKLIKDLDIIVLNKIIDANLLSLTFSAKNINTILINSQCPNEYKDFVLAHEVSHILHHDNAQRGFSVIFNNKDKFEYQANIFATVFLGCEYRDCSQDDSIQKIINYVLCNINVSDLKILE